MEASAEPPPLPSAGAASSAPSSPRSLLLFHAIVKRQNIGQMLRSAAAFGVSEALVSGSAGYHVFGAKGTERHVPVREFERFADAVAWLRARGVAVCGIEIDARAADVATRPFVGDTCFVPGNEGAGLSEAQKALCDQLVYVRQVGNGTASLNVAAATAIVLHHFAEWARMPERPREEGRDKFVVEPAPRGAALSGAAADVAARKREARQRLRDCNDGPLSGAAGGGGEEEDSDDGGGGGNDGGGGSEECGEGAAAATGAVEAPR